LRYGLYSSLCRGGLGASSRTPNQCPEYDERWYHSTHQHPLPTDRLLNRAGYEGADRLRAGYQEVVARLHLGAFGRTIAFGKQTRSADIQKIPPDSEKNQCYPELRDGHTRQSNGNT